MYLNRKAENPVLSSIGMNNDLSKQLRNGGAPVRSFRKEKLGRQVFFQKKVVAKR